MTTQCPDAVETIPSVALEWSDHSADYWLLDSGAVYHNGEKKFVNKYLESSLLDDRTIGCMVSKEGNLHVYINGADKGIVWTGLPTHTRFWGVADVYCLIKKIQIVSGEQYTMNINKHLLCKFMFLHLENDTHHNDTICPLNNPFKNKKNSNPDKVRNSSPPAEPLQHESSSPAEPLLQESSPPAEPLLQESSPPAEPISSDVSLKDMKSILHQQNAHLQENNAALLQDNAQLQRENTYLQEGITRLLKDNSHFQETVTHLQQEKEQVQQENTQLQLKVAEIQKDKVQLKQDSGRLQNEVAVIQQDKTRLQNEVTRLQENSTQLQQEVARLQEETRHLQSRLDQQPKLGSDVDISFWVVSHNEVRSTGQFLGAGGWGTVVVGSFRGQDVAMKQLHSVISSSKYYKELLRREISLMVKVRHPNLLLFIAAVLDSPSNTPIIITELMDTDLRQAYHNSQLSNNGVKLSILRDVAAALNYLHLQLNPIIHRDVSSANVLLQALPNNKWRGKLSDFGSANLVQHASTPGPGAAMYTAPEVFKRVQQTPKMDCYSFGKLLCEVFTNCLPDPDAFPSMLQCVGKDWPLMHQLITTCVQDDPNKRPEMSYIVSQLNLFTSKQQK